MRRLLPVICLASFGACSGPVSYTRPTLAPLPDAFACSQNQLRDLGYETELVDSVGGLLQGHREITGIREAARRGASAATEVITVGLAGGKLTRFDELTVFVYKRQYPHGNTVEVTAGMLTVTDEAREQGSPTDAAKRDAKTVLSRCADWDNPS